MSQHTTRRVLSTDPNAGTPLPPELIEAIQRQGGTSPQELRMLADSTRGMLPPSRVDDQLPPGLPQSERAWPSPRGLLTAVAGPASRLGGVATGQTLRGLGNVAHAIGGSLGAQIGPNIPLGPDAPFMKSSLMAQVGRAISDYVGDPLVRGGESMVETFGAQPTTQWTQQRAYDAAEAAQKAAEATTALREKPPLRVLMSETPTMLPTTPPELSEADLLRLNANPDWLGREVVPWSQDRARIAGTGQSRNLLRSDESVLGLAREQATAQGTPPPTRLNQYPNPTGEDELSKALRQRRHIAEKTGNLPTQRRTPATPVAGALSSGAPSPGSIDVTMAPETIRKAEAATKKAQLRSQKAAGRWAAGPATAGRKAAQLLTRRVLPGVGTALTAYDVLQWLLENTPTTTDQPYQPGMPMVPPSLPLSRPPR